MNYAFMEKCDPNAGLLPIASLNVSVKVDDLADESEVIDTVADPNTQDSSATLSDRLDVQAFMSVLPPRLRDIAYRTYWLGQSQAEIACAHEITASAVSHALARVHTSGRAYFGLTNY